MSHCSVLSKARSSSAQENISAYIATILACAAASVQRFVPAVVCTLGGARIGRRTRVSSEDQSDISTRWSWGTLMRGSSRNPSSSASSILGILIENGRREKRWVLYFVALTAMNSRETSVGTFVLIRSDRRGTEGQNIFEIQVIGIHPEFPDAYERRALSWVKTTASFSVSKGFHFRGKNCLLSTLRI